MKGAVIICKNLKLTRVSDETVILLATLCVCRAVPGSGGRGMWITNNDI